MSDTNYTDVQSATSAPIVVPPGENVVGDGSESYAVYLLWFCLTMFLLTWGYGAVKAIFEQEEMPATGAISPPQTEKGPTKKQRRQRLEQYFKSAKNKMVRE